jgi:hypothetical protein
MLGTNFDDVSLAENKSTETARPDSAAFFAGGNGSFRPFMNADARTLLFTPLSKYLAILTRQISVF